MKTKRIKWERQKHSALSGFKSGILFVIDGSDGDGYSIRIIGFTNSVQFFHVAKPLKSLTKAKSFCENKLQEHINHLKERLADLES